MDEKFQNAEQAYFVLREKLEAGRITRQELEVSLKDQMVQDEQGRYWTMGIDSGKWYVHDGKDWVQAAPPSGAPSAGEKTTPSIASAPPTRKSNRLAIMAALGCLAMICLLGIGGAAFIYLNPAAPRPTLAAVATASGAIVTTPSPNAVTATREIIADAVPTSTSEPTATLPPPPDTPVPIPTSSPTSAFPPGVYITALRTNPPQPLRRQDLFFDVRFINTSGGPRSYRWLVYIFRSDASQQRNSLGETPSFPFTFPTGSSEIEIGTWRLTGAGGCEGFVARVAWLDDNKRPTMFTRTDGQMFEQPFQVCP